MKAVLIGTAAYRWIYNDVDLICDQEFADRLVVSKIYDGRLGTHYCNPGSFEATVPKKGTAFEMVLNLKHALTRKIAVPTSRCIAMTSVASERTQLALKKAHLILPHKWHHHMKEYTFLKWAFTPGPIGDDARWDCNYSVLDAFDQPTLRIYNQHRKECLEIAKAHPKLNTTKNEFFEDADFKLFDHDSIHRAIALEDAPAYTLMLDGEVKCSRSKWRLMTHKRKLDCMIEEASILALERAILPSLYLENIPYRGAKWAYEMALYKICTTITSGWFRDFCIENHTRALDSRPDFIAKFFDGLKVGKIKILKPEVVCA
jgi:hypothetical protein